MYIHEQLRERAASARPVRVGLIGAGKFGSMFLSQAPSTIGLEVSVIADLDPDRARAACRAVGWSDALTNRTTFTDDALDVMRADDVDVVVEATGNPAAGIAHARAAFAAGKHIVMVNVEADVLAGPLLAAEARDAGVVYTMAYGDQPALTCEMVEWARISGFEVVAAGKGTKYLPSYHGSTPDTVWEHYGLTAGQAHAAGMNSRMFNSFLDGTKSAIEMAAIANATGLAPPPDGLRFPPCGRDDLAHVLRPAEDGGQLHHKGQVEVVSSIERDGRPVPNDLRWGGLRRHRSPQRLLRGLLPPVRNEYRRVGPILGDVQAVPSHRAGAERLDSFGRPARTADRSDERLRRRRGRDREARSRGRRDPRRRRRLHGLRQAPAGAYVART